MMKSEIAFNKLKNQVKHLNTQHLKQLRNIIDMELRKRDGWPGFRLAKQISGYITQGFNIRARYNRRHAKDNRATARSDGHRD